MVVEGTPRCCPCHRRATLLRNRHRKRCIQRGINFPVSGPTFTFMVRNTFSHEWNSRSGWMFSLFVRSASPPPRPDASVVGALLTSPVFPVIMDNVSQAGKCCNLLPLHWLSVSVQPTLSVLISLQFVINTWCKRLTIIIFVISEWDW